MMWTTLDGVAEWPDYPEDPASTHDASEEPMYAPRMASIDTIFLGRNTYEKWASFWPKMKDDPNARPFDKSFSRFADRVEKVVFSKTLARADWPNSRIVRGDISQEVARLKDLPGGDMALLGGPRLGQAFLERDLVDELILQVAPSVVGRGKPFFRVAANPDNQEDIVPIGAPGRRDFKPVEAKLSPDGTLFLWYRRAR